MEFIKNYIDILKRLSSLKEDKHKQSLVKNTLIVTGSQNKEDFKVFLINNFQKEAEERNNLKMLFNGLSLSEKNVFINFVWSCNVSYLISLEIKKSINSFTEILKEMDKNNREKYLKDEALKGYLNSYLELSEENNFYHEFISVLTGFLDDKNNGEEAKEIRRTFSNYKERVFYSESQKNSVTYKFLNEHLKRCSCFLFGEFEDAYNQKAQHHCLLEALRNPQETDFHDVKYIIHSTLKDLFSDEIYENFTQQKIVMKFYNFLNETEFVGDNEKIFLYNSIVKGYMEDDTYYFVKLVKSQAPNILIHNSSMLDYPEDIVDIKDSLSVDVKYYELFKKISNSINKYDHKANKLDVDANILDIEDLKFILFAIREVFEKSGLEIKFSENILKENLLGESSSISFSYEGLAGNELKKIVDLYLESFNYVASQVFNILSEFHKALENKDSESLIAILDVYYEENVSHLVEKEIMRKEVMKNSRRGIKKW